MIPLWDWIKRGYVRLVEPVASLLVRHGVHPNVITTLGTCCSIGGGIIYGAGHIRTGGWFLGLTAFFDVVDGEVARRTGLSSIFGAFYDSTLDRIADAAVLKLYPNRLQITITERHAFALWQKNGRLSVIAADGTVL